MFEFIASKPSPSAVPFFPQTCEVGYLVPGDVQRDGRRRPRQLLDDAAIFELVEDVARLAQAGKAGKARAAGADSPGGNGDAIGGDLLLDGVDVDAAAREPLAEAFVVAPQRFLPPGILGLDRGRADHIGHGRLPISA
ncbi:hypothetical protein ABIA13_003230 [Sinorhizobium fredii]